MQNKNSLWTQKLKRICQHVTNFLHNKFGSPAFSSYICSMEETRKVLFSAEFEEFYQSLSPRIQEKYDYALNIIRTQYVVNAKFVKHLDGTAFYELRVSISSDEYRTILFAVDSDNFIQSRTVLLLNSFVKKSTKQYKSEIRIAENILNKYVEE